MSDAVLVAIIGGSFATLTVIGQALVAVSSRNHTNRTLGEANGQGTVIEMLKQAIHTGEAAKEAAEGAQRSGDVTKDWCLTHDVNDDIRFDGVTGDIAAVASQVQECKEDIQALRPLIKGES